jgi:tetratricopeptide (TPR) repeat protein
MAQLKALFSPIPYLLQRGEVTAYDKMIERFEKSRRAGRQEPDCIIYEKIGAVLEQRRHRVGPDVVSDLIQNANLLSSDDESTGVSPVLYHEVNRSIRRMAAEAATERRIAAWLYMRHRYTLGEIASDYGRQIEFRRLAVSIRRALGSGMTREDKRGHALNVVREIAEEVAKLRRLKSIARLDVSRATIEDAMDEVQVIIDEAKLDRDQGAEGIQHAIIRLKQAVRLLERVGWSTGLGPRGVATDAQEKAAAKMADCLGMIGGNYRRIGDAKAALRWFKKGRKLEQDARFDIESTYNLGNEISTSIELGGKPGTPTMRASLRKALETMKRRTEGNRHRDRWAWADQGQCCLLLNDYEQAEKAYERFLNLGDRRATITSVLPVLAKLHQALVYSGDPTSESIALGIAYLEREATKLV